MKKVTFCLMLSLLVLIQFSPFFYGINYYASEIASEQNSEQTETDASEIELETSQTDTVDSEISKKTAVESEVSSEDTSEIELEKEPIADSSSTLEDVEISAKMTIDETGASSKVRSSSVVNGENVSSSENQLRIDANAGEASIQISPETQQTSGERSTRADDYENQEIYYRIDEQGNLSTGSLIEPKAAKLDANENLITVYNEQIVDASSAVARMSGGYNYTFYMYPSIDDLIAQENGVSMSGGGFDATFVESVKRDGKYYFHIKISGYDGYVNAADVQLIPSQLIKARSYYTVENGSWVYYSAIDPLTSDKYDKMEIGIAPSDAQVGVKYYSDDDINYYTDEIISKSANARVSYNSYFMNLPFRSESNYTATDFKNYLKSKGKTDSEYYNATSAFTDVQKLENVNALMIFAMANHESAYGTSGYARACYNFFGRGAIDSDPDQACEYYNYPTARDGILAQSLFLQNGYFNILDWRFSGTHVGNKASGMNVKYASDPDWGKKISNHAYMMDQYGGKKNEGKYSILEVTGIKHVFTGSDLKTNVKSSSGTTSLNYYDLSQMAGTSNTINVIATTQKDNAYQILVPTGVKQSSSSVCSYTPSKRGSYPNYEGRSKVSVATNTANYSCDYESYSAQKYWISKSNTRLLAGPSIPNANSYKYTYYDNGKKKVRFTIDGETNDVIYAIAYDQEGRIERRYTYYPGAKYGDQMNHKKVRFEVDPATQYMVNATKYDEQGRIISRFFYQDKTKYSDRKENYKFIYYIDPKTQYIDYMNKYNSDGKLISKYLYFDKTTFANRSGRKSLIYYLQTGTTNVVKCYKYNTNGNLIRVYEYWGTPKYGTQGDHIKYRFWMKPDFIIDYARKYHDGANGSPYYEYRYEKGTKYGQNHGSKIVSRIDI